MKRIYIGLYWIKVFLIVRINEFTFKQNCNCHQHKRLLITNSHVLDVLAYTNLIYIYLHIYVFEDERNKKMQSHV